MRAYSIPLDFHHRQNPEPVIPSETTPKRLSFGHANARGIKCLQRLRKVEAKVRSADAVVRTLRR
jgi:hypothetical protein